MSGRVERKLGILRVAADGEFDQPASWKEPIDDLLPGCVRAFPNTPPIWYSALL